MGTMLPQDGQVAIRLDLGKGVPLTQSGARALVALLLAEADCADTDAHNVVFSIEVGGGANSRCFPITITPERAREAAKEIEAGISLSASRLAAGRAVGKTDRIVRDQNQEIVEIHTVYQY